jgi:hypothetical protein
MAADRKPVLPEFYGSVFEGYACNYFRSNFWRFQHSIGDFDDAMAEAALVYCECRRLYGAKVNSLPHFMALYKRTMYCWFTDWSNWDSRQREMIDPYQQYEYSPDETSSKIAVTFQEPGVVALLKGASCELLSVVKLILDSPKEILEILGNGQKDKDEDPDLFFRNAVQYCGYAKEQAPILKEELLHLLT